MKTLITEFKVGDKILLDFGYNLAENWKWTKITRINKHKGLWGKEELTVSTDNGTERIDSSFYLDEFADRIPKKKN